MKTKMKETTKGISIHFDEMTLGEGGALSNALVAYANAGSRVGYDVACSARRAAIVQMDGCFASCFESMLVE